MKGQKSWNKGKKMAYHPRPKNRGRAPWNKGKNLPESTRKKMSIARLGKHFKFPIIKVKRPLPRGENHHWWKGGISKDRKFRRRLRRNLERNVEGSHTQGEWDILKIQYGFRCPACLEKESNIALTEDHIVPLSKGGSDFIENIQPLCMPCNRKKYTKTIRY